MILEIVVALILLVLAYAWVGYPLVLAVWASVRKAGEWPLSPVPAADPLAGIRDVTVVLSAYNEESVIRDRLANLVEEIEKIRIGGTARVWVGVDGAGDRTAGNAQAFAASHSCVTVSVFPDRRGKVAVLKDLVARSGLERGTGNAERGTADVLVFTDANTFFAPGALGRLLAPFADPQVGGVCGRLILAGRHGSRFSAEAVYWGWENRLKEWESRLDSCLGANGAIYALRAPLFWSAIPDHTVVDDFVIGMKVREQRHRMVYEPSAVAEEETPRAAHEWARRVRIGAGDFQSLVLCQGCLDRRHGLFAWMFFSHKVLRWFTPHLLLFVAACALLDAAGLGTSAARSLSQRAGVAMLLWILCAAAGRAFRRSDLALTAPFKACDHFLTMQAALFAGFLRYCRGPLAGTWSPTPR